MTQQTILNYLSEITDPEIPVLNIVEMGIVRNVSFNVNQTVITITPTYSGCPAMRMIEEEIITTLKEKGVENVHLKTVYSPAWTTDWLGETAKEKLQKYGIAPPQHIVQSELVQITLPQKIICPYCLSEKTILKSEFSSTSCKALYYCNSCIQPFEHFKEI